jgi:hypothetical protein
MRWEAQVLCMGEMRNEYKSLIKSCKRKRSVGRPARRCEYYIKMDLKDRRREIILSAKGQIVGSCENGDKASVSIQCEKCSDYLGIFWLPKEHSAARSCSLK